MKYQFLKKIYDVINQVCTFKFEILTIFVAFPLPSMVTGTKLHVFNLIWQLNESGDLSFFIAQFDVTYENALLCKIKKKSMLVSFTYS